MLERDPEMDMSADARVVERDLQHLIVSEKRRVLLVLHSYGGVPGMEAALKEYGLRDRLAANNAGGIIGILCISAFLVLPNTSLEDLNGGNPAPFVIVHVSLYPYYEEDHTALTSEANSLMGAQQLEILLSISSMTWTLKYGTNGLPNW